MKKLIQSLCLATMAAFTFNACSDVPAPYDIPGSGTQNNGVYISESFSNTLGEFKSISAEGNLSWTIDYSSACITGYNSADKTNTAGITYLVSPTIDLSQSAGAYISFSHAINYERGDLAANNQLVISKEPTSHSVMPSTMNVEIWPQITSWSSLKISLAMSPKPTGKP